MGSIDTITQNALMKRINRALAKEGERLTVTRGERWRSELGDFYVLDVNMNAVVAKHCDPEKLGRELGVLRKWERLAESA